MRDHTPLSVLEEMAGFETAVEGYPEVRIAQSKELSARQ